MRKIYRLLCWMLPVTTLLGVLPAFGQSKVYINDDFESRRPNPEYWNVNYPDDPECYIEYLFNAVTCRVGWVYDPYAEIVSPTTMKYEGLYKLESWPVKINPRGELLVRWDTWYIADRSSTERNFGLRIRRLDSDWDTIFALRPQDSILPAYPPDDADNMGLGFRSEFNIGEEYNGDSVILQIFFYNPADAKDHIIVCLVDDVFLASYAKEPAVTTSVLSNPFLYGQNFNLSINCENSSVEDISSVQYAYSINEGSPKTLDAIEFSPILEKYRGKENKSLTIETAGAIAGANTLKIWAVKINGEAAVNADTTVYPFTFVDESSLSQQFVPLMECFSSSTCSPCATWNGYLNPVLEELKEAGKINVIKCQMNMPGAGDPYYLEESGIRYNEVYGPLPGVPSPIYNGESNMQDWDRHGEQAPAEYLPLLMDDLKEKVSIAYTSKAVMAIDIKKAVAYTSTSLMDIELEVNPAISAEANLMVVVIEGDTYNNKRSNGEKEFHNVAMAYVTGAKGIAKAFEAGKKETFTYRVDMNPTFMEEITDLQIVCFLQNPENNQIFQSAGETVSTETANERPANALSVKIYPNPTSGEFTISMPAAGSIDIYGIDGRPVQSAQAVAAGNRSFTLKNSGVYMVRAVCGNNVVVKRIVVR